MQRALLLVVVVALAGCRAPGARIDPFAPAGAQRVPAPATGTLGTPTPQAAAPYYPNGLSQAPPANTWQPAGNSAPGIAGLGTPNVGVNANSQFGVAQPSAPATIRSQTFPVNTGTLQAPPTNPPANSGQFLNASAPSTNLTPPPTLPNNNFAPAPAAAPAPTGGSIFNQPLPGWPTNTGAPPANQLNGYGMPVNDATTAYPQPPQSNVPTPSWNVGGLRNWIQSQPWLTTQAQPTYSPHPATNYAGGGVAQVGATTPIATANPYGAVGTGVATPMPTATPAAGYSTVPGATALPMRGMPNAVQPAGWTTPAASPTPASPTASNLHMPATVRGNLDSDGQPLAFVPTGQSSPTPHAAEMFGHHDQYLWLRGKLEYSSINKQWKLRYIPLDAAEGRIDNYGGSVVLVDNGQLSNFKSGDFVMVQGRIGEKSSASSYAPNYHVQQVTPLE